MLNQVETLKGYKLHARDGAIGSVSEFYFDDQYWTIRYLVAETGSWLFRRQVLISPYALLDVNKESKSISINLRKKQIEESPSLDSDQPVSRQFEGSYYGYYGWPQYWGGENVWGYYPYIERRSELWNTSFPVVLAKSGDPHLRSTQDVSGHHVVATDGEIGHISDFIIDSETWMIRYLILDTQNWWPGKKVLVSPMWVNRVSWDEAKVFVNISRVEIQQSPAYTEDTLILRNFEEGLFSHYNKRGYWLDQRAA